MTQEINTSQAAGGREYTWATTITADHDIHADTVQVSLGSYAEPGTWVAPSTDPAQSNPNQRVVSLLIDNEIAPGDYWLWVRITDSPEIVPRRGAKITVI